MTMSKWFCGEQSNEVKTGLGSLPVYTAARKKAFHDTYEYAITGIYEARDYVHPVDNRATKAKFHGSSSFSLSYISNHFNRANIPLLWGYLARSMHLTDTMEGCKLLNFVPSKGCRDIHFLRRPRVMWNMKLDIIIMWWGQKREKNCLP